MTNIIKFEDIELKRYNIFTSNDREYENISRRFGFGTDESVVFYYCPENGLSPKRQQEEIKRIIIHFNRTHGRKLIIFSYSSYIMAMLNNLLFAYSIKDKQAIYLQDVLMNPKETNAYHIRSDNMCVDMWDERCELFVCEDLEADTLDDEAFRKLMDIKHTFTWDGIDYHIRENDEYDHPFITCGSCFARSYFTRNCELCDDAFDQFNNTEGADINE